MIADFADPKEGGFFYTADDHESLLARPKDPYDNALPSGNSVAIRNLVALAAVTGEPALPRRGGQGPRRLQRHAGAGPGSIPLMLVGPGRVPRRPPRRRRRCPAPADDLPGGQEVVSAQAALEPDAKVAPGAELDVTLTLSVKPGWHVYANPSGVETLKPTTVALAADQPATLVKVEYPAGASKVLASSGDEKVNLYEGKATLTARVRLARDLKPGASALTFQVRYQACNDRACLAPATLAVTVPLTVAP